MDKRRRRLLTGLGTLAFGSGATLTAGSFNNSTQSASDMRVVVAENLEVRAGPAFNDDGSIDTSNSNIDTDLYIDPRDTGNSVGKDFYDGSDLGPVFDDRDPPLATVSARGDGVSDDYAGINEDSRCTSSLL